MKRIIIKKIISSCVIVFISTSLLIAKTRVYFSPNGGCRKAIIHEIETAKKNIDIAMYDFTSPLLAYILLQAQQRGVVIRVFIDKSESGKKFSKSRYLKAKGIPVIIKRRHGRMHNKFAVIDNRVVITGSYNWTNKAEENNDENLLIIDDAEVVQQYEKRFEKFMRD